MKLSIYKGNFCEEVCKTQTHNSCSLTLASYIHLRWLLLLIFSLFEGLEYTSHQHVLPHICSSKRKTRWRRWARWPHRGGGGEDFCEGPPASLLIPLPSLAPNRQRKLSASLLYSISGWRYLCPHNTFLGLESPIALALDRLPCSLMFLFDPSGSRICGECGASVL